MQRCTEHAHKRANYQALIWCQVDMADVTIPPPDRHGWEVKDGKLDYKWTAGELMPDELSDVLVEKQETDEEEQQEEEDTTQEEEEEGRKEKKMNF